MLVQIKNILVYVEPAYKQSKDAIQNWLEEIGE